MVELVFRSVPKITHADWLLTCPNFYNVGSAQYAFYTGQVRFGGKNLQTDFNEL